MRLSDDMTVELYRRLGLEDTSRTVPIVYVRHAVRQLIRSHRTLPQICEIEERVTGIRTNHSTVINSLRQSGEHIDDASAEVIMTVADLLREKGY